MGLKYDVSQQSHRVAARTQTATGKWRCGQTDALVTVHLAEPFGLRLPLVSIRDDLVVGAAHEVPPHHDFLAERLAAQQYNPCTVPSCEGQRAPAGAGVTERTWRERGPLHRHVTRVEQ